MVPRGLSCDPNYEPLGSLLSVENTYTLDLALKNKKKCYRQMAAGFRRNKSNITDRWLPDLEKNNLLLQTDGYEI